MRDHARPLLPKQRARRVESGSDAAHVDCVLVIAGIDPGGGAGLAADVRAIEAAGAFACPVVATITVQSTAGLVSQTPISAALVARQAAAVIAHQRVRAIKVGALGDARNVKAVARIARANPAIPLVIDPVRVPSRGRGRLLDAAGAALVARELVPLATLITPNADEAFALTRVRVHDVASAKRAACKLLEMGARAALVKGGHLGGRDAVDVLAVGDDIIELRLRRIGVDAQRGLHGGGCALASLVAARLARARVVDAAAIKASVQWSKRRHHRAITRAANVGGPALVLANW